MRGKTVILYTVLCLALLAAIGASAFSLSQYLRLRESRRLMDEQLSARIEKILDHCRDQILRHPDYDLQAERAFLTAFSRRSPAEQRQKLAELETFSARMTEKLLEQAAGVESGDPIWTELRRFKTFSPNGFKELYEGLDYPRAERITAAPAISGDAAADRRIVALAMARGYRLREQAEEEALAETGPHRLQVPALRGWLELQAAAREEGVRLELISAYRSVERQRAIFLRELGNLSGRSGIGHQLPEAIAAGQMDGQIGEVLRYSSIPGFSKHHSGYTIDITDPQADDPFSDFAGTEGFRWISAHNYLNAKRFGFIPSYPEGALRQGPEPEAWEYVWVGPDALVQNPPSLR